MKALLKKLLGRRNGRLTTYADRYRLAAALSVLPLPLEWVLALFGSDKQRAGEHNYGASYARLMRGHRTKRLKILEIGILGGDSLLAWRAFFPRAIIVGVDIEEKPWAARGRTRVYQCDQSSAADLAGIAAVEAPFDIIIDDGSHQSRHQIFTFQYLFDHLKDGGLYIIEDVQTSFWSGEVNGWQWDGSHIDKPAFGNSCYGWCLDLAKYVNHAEFRSMEGVDAEKLKLGRSIRRITFEHNLIILEKGAN